MRVLALISLALSATIAQGAVLSARAVTAAATTEINDLKTIVTQLQLLTTEVNAYTVSSGYSGALKINGDEGTLETDIKTATTDCGNLASPVTDEDATAILAEVQQLVPVVQGALTAIVNKKSTFAQVPFVTPLVTNDLTNLKTLTNSLDSCLLSHTPADQTTTAQGYITTINTAFTNACTAYGITC
ncbi:hypothetical protein Unana1_04448 [Umbelopsis nana]